MDPHEPITHAGVEELDQMMSNSKKYPVLDVGMGKLCLVQRNDRLLLRFIIFFLAELLQAHNC